MSFEEDLDYICFKLEQKGGELIGSAPCDCPRCYAEAIYDQFAPSDFSDASDPSDLEDASEEESSEEEEEEEVEEEVEEEAEEVFYMEDE